MGHRDDVRPQALGWDLGDDVEGVEHLLDALRAREGGGEQRALGGELALEPLDLLGLVPLEVRAEAEVGGDRVEGLGVALGLLAEVEAREREAEGAHAADQVE